MMKKSQGEKPRRTGEDTATPIDNENPRKK